MCAALMSTALTHSLALRAPPLGGAHFSTQTPFAFSITSFDKVLTELQPCAIIRELSSMIFRVVALVDFAVICVLLILHNF